MKKLSIKVEGMSCSHCAGSVIRGLSELEGIKNVKVNLKKKEVRFKFEEAILALKTIYETIESLGYRVLSDGQ